MRLALKLTAAISIAVAIGLVVQAVIHHRRIAAMRARDAHEDLAVLARAMQGAVAEIWNNSGPDAAARYVERANDRRAATTIALHAAGDTPPARPGTLVQPVTVAGERVATLSLYREPDSKHELRDELISTQVITTVALILVVGAIALLLGRRFVARPAAHLIEQVRRIGEGDYEPAPVIGQRDEIGRLARSINDLALRLQEARDAARDQRRARAEALEQLRHADRLATVGKLASGIAHELGTPLNVVSGRATMIAARDAAPEEVKRDAHIIAERAEHMASIIRQLLDFARRGVQKSRTSVQELLERATTLVEALAERYDVSIEIADTQRGHTADVDAGKVLQVLTNLMVNAVQAMPDGGTITLSASSEQVSSPPDERSAPGRYVCLVVQDEGVGIPIEQLDQIFDPFFTTKSAREGTGLGLSVCHGLVREHGGWIDVDSTPGEGTRFAVYLPEGDPA